MVSRSVILAGNRRTPKRIWERALTDCYRANDGAYKRLLNDEAFNPVTAPQQENNLRNLPYLKVICL
jgi:hypothetical protein